MDRRNRLEYVDNMRGIAITLVVVGHLIQFNEIPMKNSIFELSNKLKHFLKK